MNGCWPAKETAVQAETAGRKCRQQRRSGEGTSSSNQRTRDDSAPRSAAPALLRSFRCSRDEKFRELRHVCGGQLAGEVVATLLLERAFAEAVFGPDAVVAVAQLSSGGRRMYFCRIISHALSCACCGVIFCSVSIWRVRASISSIVLSCLAKRFPQGAVRFHFANHCGTKFPTMLLGHQSVLRQIDFVGHLSFQSQRADRRDSRPFHCA